MGFETGMTSAISYNCDDSITAAHIITIITHILVSFTAAQIDEISYN